MDQERKLAAIMFTDIVGYTAMMQEDESKAVKIRKRHREVFDAHTEKHHGKTLQYYGDGTLSIFNSAIDAVTCAIEMQTAFQQWPQIPVRIGIHMGDIIYSDVEVIGDGVNIASRIESLGVAGSVLISDRIYEEIENQRQIQTNSLGSFDLKNVSRPFEVFAINKEGLVVPRKDQIVGKVANTESGGPKYSRSSLGRLSIIAVAILVLVLGGIYILNSIGFLEGSGGSKVPEKSIAVLPFVNMSGDIEQEYFSDGITEEILNSLAQLEGLKVASRTSSFSFKGKNEDLSSIAEKLNVANVLEGSVQKSGNNIRITAQLISARDGFHIWSERYDRKLDDIFTIQDDISSRIAEKLQISLLGKQQLFSGEAPTKNLEAHELLLKGKYFFRQRAEGVDKALEYFQRAVKIDPNYAAAHEAIGRSYLLIASYGSQPSSVTVPLARKAIERTLELNPNRPGAHLLLAEIKLVYDWNWEEAKEEFNKATELGLESPSIFEAFYHAAVYNDLDTAILITQQVHKNHPLDISNLVDLANFFSWNYKYAEAREVVDRILELEPSYGEAYRIKGEIYLLEGDKSKAIAEFERSADLSESEEWLREMMIPFIKNMDNEDYMARMFEQLEKAAKDGQVPTMNMINAYGYMGRNDDALKWIRRGIEEKDYFTYRLQINPYLRPLHDDPRWLQILGEVGFPLSESH